MTIGLSFVRPSMKEPDSMNRQTKQSKSNKSNRTISRAQLSERLNLAELADNELHAITGGAIAATFGVACMPPTSGI
jgi:hypothetical protein